MRFTEILLAATVITGFIWLFDIFFLKAKRQKANTGSGSEEEPKEPLLVEYAKAFFPILLLVLIIRSFIIEPFRIPSGSMRPTLVEGDFILVNKYNYGLRMPFSGKKIVDIGEPKRGDVVVFKHLKRGEESIDMIKRVVGLPGDRVQYKDKIIYVNGKPIQQQFQKEQIDKDPEGVRSSAVRLQSETLGNIKHDIFVDVEPVTRQMRFDDVVVPPNSYFVMGDNRDHSDDSRFWGFVKEEDILGRAMGIWLSWNGKKEGSECLKECVRWERIGKSLGTPVGT